VDGEGGLGGVIRSRCGDANTADRRGCVCVRLEREREGGGGGEIDRQIKRERGASVAESALY
jgi:hypothetical protein